MARSTMLLDIILISFMSAALSAVQFLEWVQKSSNGKVNAKRNYPLCVGLVGARWRWMTRAGASAAAVERGSR